MKQQESDFNKKKYLARFIIVACTIWAAIILYSCENNIEKIKAFNSSENLPVVEATDFETLYTDSGIVRFYLKAPKLLRFETEGEPYVEFPQGIELVKYDNQHNIISGITAEYAKQFVEEKKWEAKNNVVATNNKGDTLKTEHLIWEEETEKIYTEEYVRIIKTDQIITGIGFESDQSLENWRIKDPKGTIYVDVKNPKDNDNNERQNNPVNKNNEVDSFQEAIKLK
jgi:LPS export ABC transporter protein LptC